MKKRKTKLIEVVPSDRYWPCACVKRNRKGLMTAIKCHHPSVAKCGKCGSLRTAI